MRKCVVSPKEMAPTVTHHQEEFTFKTASLTTWSGCYHSTATFNRVLQWNVAPLPQSGVYDGSIPDKDHKVCVPCCEYMYSTAMYCKLSTGPSFVLA